jgi:hypothetical protein
MINFGNISQMSIIVGWLPHDLVLSVNSRDEYLMRFNVQTYDQENALSIIPCIVEKEMAKTLYNEYQQMDTVVLWGELKHTYHPKLPRALQTYLQFKVLGYSLVSDFINGVHDPEVSKEKREYLKEMSDIYDNNIGKPTMQEKKYWKDYWLDWKKRNAKKKKK